MALPNTRQFDFSDPALRQQLGLKGEGSQTVLGRSEWRKVPKQSYRSRVETQRLILKVLHAASKPLSRREILLHLSRANSPFFRDVIAEMVALGLVIEHESSYGNWFMYEYEAAQ